MPYGEKELLRDCRAHLPTVKWASAVEDGALLGVAKSGAYEAKVTARVDTAGTVHLDILHRSTGITQHITAQGFAPAVFELLAQRVAAASRVTGRLLVYGDGQDQHSGKGLSARRTAGGFVVVDRGL